MKSVWSLLVFYFISFGLVASPSNTSAFNLWFDGLQTRALSGDADAQFDLGIIHFQGKAPKNIRRDYIIAAKWLKLAARRGHINAQYRLALMYSKGQGVVKSYDKVFYWLHQAADAGHVGAQSRLGVMYFNGTGSEVDYAESVYWYQQAASQGHRGAMTNLALMYQKGHGVERNLTRAIELYQQADTEWAKRQSAKLKQLIDCRQSALVRLFLVPLKCAERDVLMMAIKDGGALVKSENKDNWGDSYQLPAGAFGVGHLQMLYTLDNQFAQARYRYLNRAKSITVLAEMKDLIASSYGAPHFHQGLDLYGWQSFEWHFTDGLEILLRQHVDSKVVELTYRDPDNFTVMVQQREQHSVALSNQRYRKISDQL